MSETLKRIRRGFLKSQPVAAKLAYFVACLAFKRVYGGQGISADSVQRKSLGMVTKVLIKLGVGLYSYFFRRKIGLRVSLLRSR